MKFSVKILFLLGIMLAVTISIAGCISSETPVSSENLVLDTPVQYADVNNISIGYREFGSETSEPLLIIIGYTTLMDDIDPDLISLFAENYHVYVYDHRGMGHTTRDVEPYQFMQLVDDADSLIGVLGYEKMYIFGHSMGSMITQHLLIYYPVAGTIYGAWFTPFIGADHSVPYEMREDIAPLVHLFFQNSEVYTP